jgi:methionyl-tRNA formyltransferase
MVRVIVKKGDVRLDTPCVPVTKFEEKLRKQVQDMKDTLINSKGLGISANQIGICKRILIIKAKTSSSITDYVVMINPKLIKASEEMIESLEGCLSIPRKAGFVQRHEQVTVEYQTVKEETRTVVLVGDESREFQHEFDHINNILFVDKATKVWNR